MGSCSGKHKRNDNESNRKSLIRNFRLFSRSKGERKRLLHVYETSPQNNKASSSTLYDLPLEVLDIILQKSYLHWISNSLMKQRDEVVVRSLMSVDVCFHRRITRQRFKKAIWRYLKDFYGKTRRRSAILRNNRNYLLEYIRPNKELISLLLSFECITQEESHLIQRQRSNRNKSDLLLKIMKPFEGKRFSNFVICLYRTNQKNMARIMEDGGGVIKLKVQTRNALLLQKEMENLQKRKSTKPRSHQTEKLINPWKDTEIVNSRHYRQTVVVWIWCRSQAALDNIRRLHESEKLWNEFFENIQPYTSKIISIDINQFQRTVVVCSISINITHRIDVRGNIFVYGVTKLRNEIYVLYGALHVIRVFEDRNAFRLRKEIKVTEIRFPFDISSSEIDNCLYVSDYSGKCVWKVSRTTDDEYKITKWLTIDYRPLTLSVSSDGQLLVIKDPPSIPNDQSSNLMIYGSDAKLIRVIQLPENLKGLRYVVETSIGNFIIIHKEEMVAADWSRGIKSIMKSVVSEMTSDGQMVIRRFIPSNETEELNDPYYLSLDSDDRVFVTDFENHRVILLDSDLAWNRILVPTEDAGTKINQPRRLCYDEEKKQLIVGYLSVVIVYTLVRN